LIGDKSLFLKCVYSSNATCESITEINFYRIKNYQKKSDVLIKPEKDIIEPVPIGIYPNPAVSTMKRITPRKSKQEIIIYRGNYDMAKLFGHDFQEDTSLVAFFCNN
jgi:hypothetical protein